MDIVVRKSGKPILDIGRPRRSPGAEEVREAAGRT
jgi:hypothetical protein